MLRAVVVACVIAIATAVGGPARACDHAQERDVYKVTHEVFGEIGRHVVTFSCEGNDLLVETRISGRATMLSVPVYRLDGHYREVWRGDQLVSFDSQIDDNGEKFEVSARLEDGHMVIDRRRGVIKAPATIIPDHPWNFAVLDRTLLFDSRRGKLRHVQVEDAGEETLRIGRRDVPAHKYQMTGDLERVLWYGKDGAWLQSQLEYGGSDVFVTREESTPSPAM